MARDLSFWKYDGEHHEQHCNVYARLSDGEYVSCVEQLPLNDILSAVEKALSGWYKPDTSHYQYSNEMIEVYTTPQFVRFDCYGVSEAHMNTLIDVMLSFDCPLYDSAIDTRFDSKTLTRDEAADYYYVKLQELLAKDGFKRQSKSFITRKIGEDIQRVAYIVTKYGSYSKITFTVQYLYQNIDMIASYIQGIPYRKGFSTGCFRKNDIPAVDNPCEHKVYSGIAASTVEAFALMDYETISTYFYPLLTLCDTPAKFLASTFDEDVVKNSLDPHCHIEWMRIATLLHLSDIESALRRFDAWDSPTNYYTRKPISTDEAKYSRYRIATWEVGRKLKNDYQMFGTQMYGKVLPVPDDYDAANKL